LVAELLASTGDFNLAGEFFNYDTVLNHVSEHGFKTFSEYFWFLSETVSCKGKLTVKLAVTHLVVLLHSGILDQIIDRSKFVMIERNDRLMQAISLSIASQTGQWTSYMSPKIGEDRLTYAPKQISMIIESIVHQQSYFDLFFAMNGIKQHTLIYEQFVAQPELHIAALGEWLGTDIDEVDLTKIRLQRQASTISTDWRERFLAEVL